jgi:hypothetical protein
MSCSAHWVAREVDALVPLFEKLWMHCARMREAQVGASA